MSTITTRAGKGSPLTNSEVDQNFTNLNNDKLESVSESDVTQHQAALSITESQISDLDKYTQSEVDTLLSNLEAYDQSLNTTDDVAFASVQLTGGTGTQGTISWNTDEETLDVILDGATLQMGQEVHYHVRNNSGATINNGEAVYATGTLGASGRITVGKFIADGSIPVKYFLGIATEDIANDTDGKIAQFGKVRGINTTAFSEGDVVYPSASTAGALTATAPDIALPVAFVISSANNGTIFVRSTNLDENYYAVYSDTQRKNTEVKNSTTTTTVDFDNHNFIITLVGNTTISLSNIAGNVGATGTIVFKQDATGGRTITWPSQFKTPRAETIVQETAANSISAVNYFIVDASTVLINYIGSFG
jgi:hypothetical protein